MRPTVVSTTGRYALLVVIAVVVLIPLLGIVLASLHPSGTLISGLQLPQDWSWENFSLAWNQAGFAGLVRSSLLISLVVVPCTAAMATLAGYAISILKVVGHRKISVAFVLGLTIPVELVIVSLYYTTREMGLSDTHLGVILAEAALFLPFGVYWMQSHFSTVPFELVEASRIDGASDLTILLRVLLPISRAAISTLSVLYFMWSWNQFLLVLVLIQDPAKRTAPAGLGFFVSQYSTNVPMLAAASVIVIAPIVLVYLMFQRNFVSGVTQGAVK